MRDFADPAFTGDHWADRYAGPLTGGPDPTAAVDLLADLCPPGGRALELAIGGGRVAIPLAARGVRVEGVEASAAVVERLRLAPGGEAIPVVTADMADVPVEGPFDLVYVVWNSLFNLVTQERQVDCLVGAARVLAPGGALVLECFVPDPQRYDGSVRTAAIAPDEATLTLTEHDAVAQVITVQHVTLGAGGTRFLPVRQRYTWPAELDLMARIAGLEREARYAGWDRSPFGPTSTGHVSVYRRPTAVPGAP